MIVRRHNDWDRVIFLAGSNASIVSEYMKIDLEADGIECARTHLDDHKSILSASKMLVQQSVFPIQDFSGIVHIFWKEDNGIEVSEGTVQAFVPLSYIRNIPDPIPLTHGVKVDVIWGLDVASNRLRQLVGV